MDMDAVEWIESSVERRELESMKLRPCGLNDGEDVFEGCRVGTWTEDWKEENEWVSVSVLDEALGVVIVPLDFAEDRMIGGLYDVSRVILDKFNAKDGVLALSFLLLPPLPSSELEDRRPLFVGDTKERG